MSETIEATVSENALARRQPPPILWFQLSELLGSSGIDCRVRNASGRMIGEPEDYSLEITARFEDWYDPSDGNWHVIQCTS